MEEIIKEAFKQGQQWGIDDAEGKAPISFTEWFKSAETQALILHVVSVSLPDDDKIEKKAEFRQKPRNPNNDNKEEFIYGFMQGADWMKSEILPNER
jgi:hypothetical protein